MGRVPRLGLAVLLVLAVASPVAAGEVRQEEGRIFGVTLTDSGGATKDLFPPGEEVVFNVRFGLALSDVSEYPVVVTLTVGGETMEAYAGKLTEGIWVVRQPVKVISNWGSAAPWKVTVKVRVYNRSVSGSDSFYSYYNAEGKLAIGYR